MTFESRQCWIAVSLLLTTLFVGCSDTDEGKPTGAESEDAGQPQTGPNDAGALFPLVEADSSRCLDARETVFPPYEEAGCSSQAEPVSDGYCAGFYCNWSPDQLACALGAPNVCGLELAQRMGCDGTLQDLVADCARQAATDIVTGARSPDDFQPDTTACVEAGVPGEVGDACVACYVVSADCARTQCLAECLSGDSPSCDECRDSMGCTPGFYRCVGSPDPWQVNPDGSTRR